jgi:hypothetical protein
MVSPNSRGSHRHPCVPSCSHAWRIALIKRIRSGTSVVAHEQSQWRSLDDSVEVELTSEDPEWPIEHALLDHKSSGWRAAAAGAQTIILVWREPTTIKRIRLVCEEQSRARTQEFTLRAFTIDGEREIVRQQFTFSPPGTTIEREEYETNLNAVSRLELVIIPAIDGGNAVATLKEWRIV